MKITMRAWGTLSKALLKSSRATESSKLAPGNLTHSSHDASTSLLDKVFFVNGKYYNVTTEIVAYMLVKSFNISSKY